MVARFVFFRISILHCTSMELQTLSPLNERWDKWEDNGNRPYLSSAWAASARVQWRTCSLKTGGGSLTGFLGRNVDVPIRQESSKTANASSQMIYFQAFEGEHLMAKGMGLNASQMWVQILVPPLPGFMTLGKSFKLLWASALRLAHSKCLTIVVVFMTSGIL